MNINQKDGGKPNDSTNPQDEFIKSHKTKSKWTPPLCDIPQHIKEFTDELAEQLRKEPSSKTKRSQNLTHRQKIAWKRLSKRKDIIIKPSDKGSGICIMTSEQYKQEVMRQLNNGAHYTKITSDESPRIAQQIQRTISKYINKGLIKEQVAELIIPPDYRPARFYCLMKIHKDIDKPPGRPIMSGNAHVTERLSEFIDREINQYVPTIPSYIKDTNHLIEILKDLNLPDNAMLTTFDVSALYTNIPHQEGTDALREFMSIRTSPQKAQMIEELAQIVLTGNVFEFNGEYFIQTHGTAMGSKMAPSFANIFMSEFERKHLPNAPIQPLIWRRYIDDILAIFTCTPEELLIFHDWLNTLHNTIKFTMDSNSEGIPFLDTYLSIENNKVRIRPYTKKTDTKQYIQPSSCHPPHIIRSIPYSQALRLKRICTHPSDLNRELINMFGYFRNREYPQELISKQFRKALLPTQETQPIM